MPDEEDKSLSESLLRASPFLIKVLELILAVLCFLLIYVPFDNRLQSNVHHAGMVYVAYCTTILVNSVLIASHLQHQRIPRRTLYIFSTICGLLFLIAGCVVLNDWWTLMHSIYFHPPKLFLDMMICSGFFAILNSIAFFVDIWFTFRYG
ncbi:uncharacterized protein LOC142330225 [Lycorma delicatula]|uniref:uncharacterized protein LOC142330225 n=1 Tax=Lycorma delicatula TaxID=130591 RepID=UPI003F519354